MKGRSDFPFLSYWTSFISGLPVSMTYGGDSLQCSHLCEAYWRRLQALLGFPLNISPKCINPAHISIESREANFQRRSCGASLQGGVDVPFKCTCGTVPPALTLRLMMSTSCRSMHSASSLPIFSCGPPSNTDNNNNKPNWRFKPRRNACGSTTKQGAHQRSHSLSHLLQHSPWCTWLPCLVLALLHTLHHDPTKNDSSLSHVKALQLLHSSISLSIQTIF